MGTKSQGASGSDRRVDTWRTARAILFIAILAMFVSLAPPKDATAASAGLVAAYGFDAGSGTSVADQSGNGNNGTVANTTWAATGKYGKALQFNGSSSLVTIPDAASLHLTSGMTLEAWVNPSTVNGSWRDVVYKGNDNFYLEGTSTNASRPDGGLIAGGSYGDAYGTAALPANTWSYLTETYDGATLRLYVNGTQVASTAHTGAISTSANPLQIGGDSIYGQFFAGMIDEVRVYNTALTATQIQADQTTPISTAGPTYSVGGSVSGLSGTVVLQDNGGDNLSVSANGPFTFATQLAGGAAYSVTVKTNPSGQTCTVANGSGTVGSANVTNVAVSCTTTPTFSVGGSVSGLSGTVVLQDNGGDDLSVAASGPFTFPTKLASGASYAVTVKTNPSGQTCTVANGSGTVGSANVTNVAVSCTTTPTFSVGGSVSGLSGTVVLQDNGGDDLSVAASGPFTFATKLASGAAYGVTVKTNPAGQTCSVANGSGTVGSANVTNVAVSCTTAPTFSVGGSVSGLSGTVVLQDNGGDDLSVAASGPFTFATKLAGGAAYSVTVKTNPSGQTCTVANGSGSIGSANVTNVAVSCAATTGPSGLVAAYGFDAGSGTTVADQSGNGNNGTVANTTWAATGKYGKALQFNGSSSLVTIPDAASLHLTSGMTLEAWVNPSTVNGSWRDVVYKGNDNFYLEGTSTNASRPDGGLIAGGSYGDAYGTAALPANTWSYLTETYDGATLRLYVNGTQVASTAHTGAISTSANPLQIGGDSLYGQFFAGMIDEVRVYNTALTATQIQTDQATPIGSSPLSAPGTLSLNAVSPTEIDLSWGAAAGGATGYLIERCSGANCTTFTQIGTSSTTTFKDITVAANNTYSYRVRATDTAGDLGPYSNIATTTTSFTVSPNNAVLTFTRTQQYAAQGPGSGSVTWLVDGVAGGNTSSGTITSSGLYTPPSTVGSHTISAATGTATASVTVYVSNYAGTFTFHNDNARDGENLNETVLTPSNVNSTTFGKRFSYPLDGLTFASPLYVPNVNIPGQGFHNVVIVATEHDSVYAFDADGRSNTPIWKDSFINPSAGVTPIPPADTGETGDIPNEIGITGTPVIDPSTNTIYLVAATKEVSGGTTTYVNRLHALDLTTGAEKFGGPIVIKASVPGNGGDNVNGTISFNNITENQRPALTLQNGELYIGFSNHGNNPPYHGWVMAYNAATLHQDWAFCTTPNAMKGGVWMGGDGIAVDSSGNLYFSTGNGTFDGPSSGGGSNDFGDTLLKLNPSGSRVDSFTPYNYSTLDANDVDLASGGIILLPDQSGAHAHEVLTAGKGGTVYLVDRDNMGGVGTGSDKQIVQSLINVFPTGGGDETGNYSSPVYYNGSVFYAPVQGQVMAFSLTNGLLSTSPTSKSTETYNGDTSTFAARGGEMAISANGSSNGILWALQSNGDSSPGTLHAYDPSNLAHEYYTSDQAGTRDQLDPWLKFTIPLVANGRVYVVSAGRLTAYGLVP